MQRTLSSRQSAKALDALLPSFRRAADLTQRTLLEIMYEDACNGSRSSFGTRDEAARRIQKKAVGEEYAFDRLASASPGPRWRRLIGKVGGEA